MRSRLWHFSSLVNCCKDSLWYCTVEDHSKETMKSEQRFRKAWTLPGSHSCVIKPSSDRRVFSTTLIVHLRNEAHQVEDSRGFVTCKYDRKWCLTCVLQVNDSEIQVTSLHPCGLSKSVMYPSLSNILWVPASKADPETGTIISEMKFCCTNEKLEIKLHRL